MSFIKIEKDIPMPEKVRTFGRPVGFEKYPWSTMEVGNSFVMNVTKEPYKSIAAKGKQYGRKFEFRRIGRKAFRVWRTA